MPGSSTRPHSRNGANAELQRPHTARQQIGEPDVYLSVPDLQVDEIKLDVENLAAHLALQARLGNLLELRAGAHVGVEKVQLEIKGVAARALLKVRLDNVYAILDRALTSIDRNPQILEGVIDTLDDTLGPGGVVAETIEGVGRTATAAAGSRGRLMRLRSVLRSVRHGTGSGHRVTKVATAAGLLGGAALAARGNGGIEKTIKELTS